MHGNWCGKALGILTATTVAGSMQVFASESAIPLTGDASGFILPAMGVLLVVSAVLGVVYVVLSKKKK